MAWYRRKDGVVTWGKVVPEGCLGCTSEQAIAFEAARKKPSNYPRHETNPEMVARVKKENEKDLADLQPLDELLAEPPDGSLAEPEAPEVPEPSPEPEPPPVPEDLEPPEAPIAFDDMHRFPNKASLVQYGATVGVTLDHSMKRNEMIAVLTDL